MPLAATEATARSLGVTSVLGDLPLPVVVAFALLTQLGDLWLLTLVVTLAYWLDADAPFVGPGLTRERTALVVAALTLFVSLSVVLKALFGLPRPPGFDVAVGSHAVPSLVRGAYEGVATASGFGFPSGHALGTTIVWGSLAWAIRVGTRRARVGLAATVILLVSVSRLVLGVHYLVDVLAGVGLGLTVLWLVVRRLETPQATFATAATVALLGAVLASLGTIAGGLTVDIAAALGFAGGGAVAWAGLGERVLGADPGHSGPAATVVGLLVLGLTLVGPVLVESVPLAVLGSAVGGAILVGWPLVAARLAGRA